VHILGGRAPRFLAPAEFRRRRLDHRRCREQFTSAVLVTMGYRNSRRCGPESGNLALLARPLGTEVMARRTFRFGSRPKSYERLRRQKHAKHNDWTSRAPKHRPRTGLPPKPTPRAVLAVPVAATIRILALLPLLSAFFFLPISAAPPLLSLGR
jgi:hypothetical protein